MKNNNELIDDYIAIKKLENLSETTINLKRSWLHKLSKDIDKSFFDVKENEIIKHLSGYAPNSVKNKKTVIIDFYKHILDLDEHKPLPKFLKNIPTPKIKINDIEYREKVVTKKEYKLLLDYCSSPKHKAILETLYNFGVRKSELISMNYRDVEYNGETTKITVRESKTKERDVIILGRSEHLLNWVEVFYPDKDKPDQPLFYAYDDDKGKRFNKASINKMIMRLTSKAGIKKHITPHDFRHTTITNLLKNGTPPTHVKTIMGLTKNSTMLQVYDHNHLKDYEDYLKQKEQETPETYKNIQKEKQTLMEKHAEEINNIKQTLNVFIKLFKQESLTNELLEKTETELFNKEEELLKSKNREMIHKNKLKIEDFELLKQLNLI